MAYKKGVQPILRGEKKLLQCTEEKKSGLTGILAKNDDVMTMTAGNNGYDIINNEMVPG